MNNPKNQNPEKAPLSFFELFQNPGKAPLRFFRAFRNPKKLFYPPPHHLHHIEGPTKRGKGRPKSISGPIFGTEEAKKIEIRPSLDKNGNIL